MGRDLGVIISHRHWISFRLFGCELRLCARCSGTVLGYGSSLTLLSMFNLEFFRFLNQFWQITLPFLFAVPSSIDWLTQSWGLRSSNNALRFAFGFLVGVGTALLSLSSLSKTAKTASLAGLSLLVIAIGFIGRNLHKTNQRQ